jgi:hypothetical protein
MKSLPGSTVAYGRYARVVIDTIAIESVGIENPQGLRFDFKVTKTLKPAPNKAAINIYNLNRDHRAQISQLKVVPVSLDVGYEGGHDQIFLGFMRVGLTTRVGPDILTHITAGDGEEKIRKSRVNVSIAKGTPADQVLRQVAESVGVDRGNLDDALRTLKGVANAFPSGTVLTGAASREMTAICKLLNIEWSVQSGKLLLLEKGKALAATALKLSQNTGMIGSPTIDNKGVMSCTMFAVQGVYPGRLVVIDGEFLQGQFRIEETEYSGDTKADTWQIAIKGKRY